MYHIIRSVNPQSVYLNHAEQEHYNHNIIASHSNRRTGTYKMKLTIVLLRVLNLVHYIGWPNFLFQGQTRKQSLGYGRKIRFK